MPTPARDISIRATPQATTAKPASIPQKTSTLYVATDSTVVDLGAGTGVFTIAAAPHCPQVIAVDVSPAMTAALRQRVHDLRLGNVTVVEAGFLSYGHRCEPVDVTYTRNALHQIPDFLEAPALDRMASFLRPGGTLRLRDLVFDFAPGDAEERIETGMVGAVTDPAVGWTAEELAEHVRSEFSPYSWLLDNLLYQTGFDITERTFQRSVYGTYTCKRRAT